METPRFSQALLDIPRLSFRAKALIFAVLATVLPSALAVGLAFWPESFWHRAPLATLVASTLASSFICLLALRTLLVALSTITDGARAGAVLAGAGQQKNAPADEVLRMMNDMDTISNRLELDGKVASSRQPPSGHRPSHARAAACRHIEGHHARFPQRRPARRDPLRPVRPPRRTLIRTWAPRRPCVPSPNASARRSAGPDRWPRSTVTASPYGSAMAPVRRARPRR